MKKIKFVKLDSRATTPTKAHEDDTCFDLYSTDFYYIEPLDRVLIGTGIAIKLPKGFEAQIRSRSGNALKRGLSVLNSPGSIDNGYRNSIGVILINLGKDAVTIGPGDRIAQMKISKVWDFEFEEVETLDETERGQNGFGSSGK